MSSPCVVASSSHRGELYSRNAQSFSSLTGRTSGLPFTQRELRVARFNEPSTPVQASALSALAPDAQGAVQGSELQSLVGKANEAINMLRPLLPLLSKIGTELWRMKQKMVQPGTDEPKEEMRRTYRHLQSIWDAMKDAGVEVQDHTNAPFNAGLSLNVISFQPMAGINSEIVIETIKPTIYYQKQRIQMGEVIVGMPEGKGTDCQNS